MNVQAELIAPGVATGISLWPIPPFFQLGASPADTLDSACVVELLLLEGAQITPEQLAEALRLQTSNRRRHLGDILVAIGAVTVRHRALPLVRLGDSLVVAVH